MADDGKAYGAFNLLGKFQRQTPTLFIVQLRPPPSSMSINAGRVDLQDQFAEALATITGNGKVGFRQWSDNPGVFTH